jgi:hypothetical protein
MHGNDISGEAYYEVANNNSNIVVIAKGATNGGTTFAGLTGNNQAIIESQRATTSFVISTYSTASSPIIFAPQRVEKMRIANDGKVGIGIINSPTILSIGGNVASSTLPETNGGIGLNIAQRGDYAVGKYFGITFTTASDGYNYPTVGIYSKVNGLSSYNGGDLVFATKNSSVISLTPSVVIDKDKQITILGLTGSGNAYACIDSTGKLYRNATICV